MAPRRPSLIKRTKKTERASSTETRLINEKYIGKDRPLDDGTDTSYTQALRWHHYMSDKTEAKRWAKQYLEKVGHKDAARKFSSVPDTSLPLTFCWTAKLFLDDWKISEYRIERTTEELLRAAKRVVEEKESTEEKKNQPSVYELTLEKISNVIADIEDLIDSNQWDFSMYEYLQVNEIPQKYISRILKYYEPLLEEWKLIGKRSETDINEAYSHLSKKEVKDRVAFLEGMINDLNRWGDNQKKSRAPRKRKPISADRKVAKLNYQIEDNALRLKSINPTSIIGASELWVFNTKYSSLTRYVAVDKGGLDIRGQTLINFDPEKSVEKRIGRKAEEVLNEVISSGKVPARKALDNVKGKANEPKGRINNNSILLRVM